MNQSRSSDADATDVVERLFEHTFRSHKIYDDPFNDLDVDVIFRRGGRAWRVPTFWRGGNTWTVRFAPREPGTYTYQLESTDPGNPDLNGQDGRVEIRAYTGTNSLLQHGSFRVSSNKRYFEHLDGTPFYWLGDTWWTGLSDRLSWEGFKTLTADRKSKGFTVVQIVAGLVPSAEEQAPVDPGFCNEGGAVWDAEFTRINPGYFDFADRRVRHLVDFGIAPAIVGGWMSVVVQMGVERMKQHWRYIIARYGAWPVFWIVGGEVLDPPAELAQHLPPSIFSTAPGWTDVTRYVRAIDPLHHPLTVHEFPPPYDVPLEDESLTDFDLVQPSHFSWPSVATAVMQLNMHYARTKVTKPIVQGEIGYEHIGGCHLEDFQRVAFWLTMLNGAAGHTYGAVGTWESYTSEKPLHRRKWSFMTWDEGMRFPGSAQVGLGASLLRKHKWWLIEPHPEWITPRGTTFLENQEHLNGFDIDLIGGYGLTDDAGISWEAERPGGLWKARNATFRLPYAAGIPGELRLVYLPYSGLARMPVPTILGLEPGVRYRACYWEPSLGIEIDLGVVERPALGGVISQYKPGQEDSTAGVAREERVISHGEFQCLVEAGDESDVVVQVDIEGGRYAGLALRFKDADNYLAAVFAAEDGELFLSERRNGKSGPVLDRTALPDFEGTVRLTAEARGGMIATSASDGVRSVTTPIVPIENWTAGAAGLFRRQGETAFEFADFEVRRCGPLVTDDHLERELQDARGHFRGNLRGPGMIEKGRATPGWNEYALTKHILLDAYRPEKFPFPRDWVLVLKSGN